MGVQEGVEMTLAIEGGHPVRSKPLHSWPHFEEDEIEAVDRVLRSGRINYWTGDEGRCFESEFAHACGSGHAVAVSNGTVALECILRALGVGPGDDVVVTSRSFVASASAVLLVGARPIFADVDAESQNITAASIEAVLTRQTRAIIAVHLFGWPCDMNAICALAERSGLKVIEDCAQAQGASYRGRPVGGIGHAAAWSFCQDKIMTTGGEGGMVTTNDPEIRRRVWEFKDHGKSWNAVHEHRQAIGFKWLHETIGTNARMTELQSAIGRIQLKKLPLWNARRTENARRLAGQLSQLKCFRTPMPADDCTHAWYKFHTFVRRETLRAGWTRDRMVAAILAEGIPAYTGSCPEIYREKLFADRGMAPASPLPVAQRLGEESMMFLIHPTLTAEELDDTARAIAKVAAVAAMQY